MLIARKILFILFVLMYCALCPVLALYSFGYILNPVKNQISQTGLIHLETIPAGARIFFGRSRYKERTPATITNLLPGQYHITLKLRGYRPWRHTVTAEEGKARTFKDILLLPEKFPPRTVSSENIYTNLTPLPENDSFILSAGKALGDFFLFNRKKEQADPLLKDGADHSEFGVSKVYAQSGRENIIVLGGTFRDQKFYFVSLDAGSPNASDITKLFNGRPQELVWTAAHPNDCFVRYGSTINRLDLRQMSIYPQFIEDIRGFGLWDKKIYVLDQYARVLRMNLGAPDREILFNGRSFDEFFKKSQFYHIKPLTDDVIIFLGEDGDLITTIPPYQIAPGDISQVRFHKRTKRLLYWSETAIGVMNFSENRPRSSPQGQYAAMETVHENGNSIQQCFWAHNGTHILFRDGGGIFLIELLPDAKRRPEYIAEVKRNTDVVYFDDDGTLFFLDPAGRLMKLTLIPQEAIFSFSLPDRDPSRSADNEL